MRPLFALLIFFAPLIGSAAPGLSTATHNSLPVFFFRNVTGAGSELSFIAETPEMRVGFKRDSVTFQIHGSSMPLRFPGADSHVKIVASEPIGGKANFLLGQNAGRWHTGVELYHRIVYRGLYPGVDLTYKGTGGRIKSEFVVAPGANPHLIRLAYLTAERVKVDSNGDLVVSAGGAELREYAPDIFQDS